ncbi:MAG: type IV toxin-antitoxin system AbiEi family antitoxin domain-containing protein [Spirochaetales bacterium]|nr:type IV toxin-antitoxin system AbiEi family antitoxin domain-containing protein [Spirochaetales bacterium]
MTKLTELFFQLSPHGLFTIQDIAAAIPGSDNKLHSLIKRAIAKEEIIRIRRGLYCLPKKYLKKHINLYAVAENIYGPSYISLESALSWHGWIPEAVYTITSISFNKSKFFKTPLGNFSYNHVPQNIFYESVERHIDENGYIFFMATPLKALVDYIYINKLDWENIEPLLESLRIEKEEFNNLQCDDFDLLAANYNNKRVYRFINGIKKELNR